MNQPGEEWRTRLARMEGIFRKAGYEEATCDILQPTGKFLDYAQRDVRSHFFMVSDQGGQNFFLRPDFTLPLADLDAAHEAKGASGPEGEKGRRVFYRGPVFRNNRGRCETREQMGIEIFRDPDKAQADAEIMSLVRDALMTAKLNDTLIRMGDPGLFDAFVQALPFDDRWRLRLRRLFRRRPVGRDGRAAGGELDLVLRRSDDMGAAQPAMLLPGHEALEAWLHRERIVHTGARTLEEVLARWREKNELPAIPASASALLERFLNIEAPAPEAMDRVLRLADKARSDGGDAQGLGRELDAWRARLEALESAGFDPNAMIFSARFLGAGLGYYMGFVFAFDPADRPGFGIAGGGRYDGSWPFGFGVGAALYLSDLHNVLSS